MFITEGLFENMVMQRSAKDCCEQAVAGCSELSGDVLFRVKRGRCSKKYKIWTKVGNARRGRFEAAVRGLPLGGPYTVELCVKSTDGRMDTLTIPNVLVGDVRVLAGQSNMEGYGNLSGRDFQNKNVRAYYMTDYWDVACDPLHNIYQAHDEVHTNLLGINAGRNPIKGAGPGLHFGLWMNKHLSVPIGLIPSAHGGSSMEQWSPKKKALKGASLYGAMLRRIRANGGKIAGLLWYQGCSETSDQLHAGYTSSMVKFIKAFRRDIKNPGLPVVMTQISRTCGQRESFTWNSIQQQQLDLPSRISRLAVVPAIDLTLDDCIHIDERSCVRLGARLGQAACALCDSKFKRYSPIAIRGIRLIKNEKAASTDIRIAFKNVIGKLVSDGSRPEGFSILDHKFRDTGFIYKTCLEKNSVLLKTSCNPKEIGNYRLAYGHGFNPFCNITDQADRSLPVFSGIALGKPGKPMLITDFIKTFWISPPLENCPDSPLPSPGDKKPGYKRITFNDSFANMHEEFAKYLGQDRTILFACRLKCSRDMKLRLHLGYDGPVKVQIDGRICFRDPNGTNPAVPEDALIPCSMAKGTHEIVVALESHRGSAYGIFLRVQRLDLPEGKKWKEVSDADLPSVTF